MADMEKLAAAMGDLDEDTVKEIIAQVMADGGTEAEKAMDACSEGMNTVGKRYEDGEYFVSDLIYSGEIMTDAVEAMKTALAGETSDDSKKSKVILATVKDDLHDIGKNIVKAFLEASGFEVVDLGIDVPAETIVKTAKDQNISIICLSGVLTLAIDSMKGVSDAFKAEGMRDSVKILIGGNPTSEENCKYTGADAWAHSPQDSVKICKAWLKDA